MRYTSLPLRQKVLLWGVTASAVVLMSTATLFVMSMQARSELGRATGAYVADQGNADAITRALLRQTVRISGLHHAPTPEARAGFEDAGEEVEALLRRFLLGDLSPTERVQLEQVRESHQRMEVAAARMTELHARGEGEEGNRAHEELLTHSLTLLTSLDGYLRLRGARLEALEARQDRLFELLILGIGALGMAILVGSLLVALLIRRRIAAPLEELARATEEIEKGNFAVRVTPGPDPEFRLLAERFHRMGAGVRRSQEELIQSEKLSAMGRMTAGLAHELNNPLAGVLGYAQLLADELRECGGPDGEALHRQYLEPILTEGARAHHLVRNFLDFSRPSGVEVGAISLKRCFEVVLSLRQFAFRQADVELSVHPVPDLQVRADEQMLQGVFLNLLNNALDALQEAPNPRLEVRFEQSEGEVEIVFQDNGPGMDRPERVFEAFYTTKPLGKGTGLGLSLAHQAVEHFGGRLRGENRAQGGAIFRVTLLLAPPSAGTLEAPASSPPEMVEEGTPPPLNGAPRILVVEDEAPLRHLHEKILSRLQPGSLHLAASAAEAREILARETVDLILCDIRMPDEDGLHFYSWLRRTRPELAEHHFLFVTGDVRGEDVRVLADQEPERFIQKPFRLEEYLERVLRGLEGIRR